MITVNTNMSGIIARNSLSKTTGSLNNALQRMSTGYKINSSKDDAAGMAISNKLEYKKSSFNVAYKNAQMGQSMLETANGSLSNINDMLHRMRDLAEQASNGTYGKDERNAMQTEVDALKNEIYRVKDTTEFNDKKLFDVPDDSTTNGTATLSNTNANKAVTLSAVSNNGIDTYANADDVILMSSISETVTDEDWANTAGKVIKIKTADDLKKLATLTNGGKDTSSRTFVLGADINMQGVNDFVPIGNSFSNTFKGEFDGQGFTISNLTINSSDNYLGLFGRTSGATINNVVLNNVEINGTTNSGSTGGLIGHADNTTVNSCFVTGHIISNAIYTGGLIGNTNDGTITNCTVNTIVENNNGTSYCRIGAFIGQSDSSISNCTASGSVIAKVPDSDVSYIGGFIGFYSTGKIDKCSSSADVSLLGTPNSDTEVGGFVGRNVTGTISNCKYTGKMDNSCSGSGKFGAIAGIGYNWGTLENNEYKYDTTFDLATGATGSTSISGVGDGDSTGTAHNPNATDSPAPAKPAKKDNYPDPTPTPTPSGSGSETNLQIGISSDDNSVIKVDTGFALGDIDISLETDSSSRQALDTIDALIAKVTNKMTSIGATQNRIESAIQYQETQIHALTASNSLIKDADIAKESAEYIKSQILQNVASSLLSTANQSPSIALNLV